MNPSVDAEPTVSLKSWNGTSADALEMMSLNMQTGDCMLSERGQQCPYSNGDVSDYIAVG
ncbi:MAG: hypothetical protein WCL29_06760 [Pseudomonadota bacterium]